MSRTSGWPPAKPWKDKTTGEKRERVTWHTVTVWNQGAVKAIETCLAKGAKVHVDGVLRYSQYTDRDGVKRSSAQIVVEAPAHKVTFLSPRQEAA